MVNKVEKSDQRIWNKASHTTAVFYCGPLQDKCDTAEIRRKLSELENEAEISLKCHWVCVTSTLEQNGSALNYCSLNVIFCLLTH